MAEGGGVEPRDRDLRSPLVFRTSCQPSSATFRNLAERAGFGPAQVSPRPQLSGPVRSHSVTSPCPERDSNSHQQRPRRCASTNCATRAIFGPPGSIRTITVRVLSAVPLPVGIRAEKLVGAEGLEPSMPFDASIAKFSAWRRRRWARSLVLRGGLEPPRRSF